MSAACGSWGAKTIILDVYKASSHTLPPSALNSRVYWLAFVVYWGIVLFGYDTGVGGGVVSQPYFQQHFGLVNADGTVNKHKSDDLSSNVVSVLQAGAFFGALGSAPISSAIGRKWTLFGFTLFFTIGAILQTIAGGSRGIGYIYAGRVVAGVGIGGISAVSPAYVSECSPKDVRGRITGFFQIMVAFGVMLSYFVNFTVKESPRWLASVDRKDEALKNLAYYRRKPVDDEEVRHEMAEIEAAIYEEQEARKGLGWKEAFLGKGNWPRFMIAVVIFTLQQWSGQNSVSYYAPQIFASIGYRGNSTNLLASGVYGILKLVSTIIFIFFFVETLGRRLSLFISAIGMGTLFFIVGALLKTHPPPSDPNVPPPPASRAMAGMLYIYVCFYSLGWGALPWVYVSDIFPTRTRHYGLATASASQWLFNFVLSKITPTLVTDLGYKIFLMFGTINILGMGTFSLLLPETKGRSLEEMDIIFGAVQVEKREADIAKEERAFRSDASSGHSEHSDEKVADKA
ncbi:hypothetical protein EIP91_007723 [Steccherinum ochraceum]|uniref:Major facilitator superfamily (MFS) profile domain-containing protein n=1 Tax=Steccherinum ochraceum TaxID=92696 RepID=A0A4R0RC26_9APHY|nr:hypothetical protein EIP91_007723 [Steccherinum ochraceum]